MSQAHYFCPLCPSANIFHNYSTLFSHIRNKHSEESSLTIRCELSMFCGSRYSSFDSYRRHIYRCHRSLIDSFDNNHNDSLDIDGIFGDHEDSFLYPFLLLINKPLSPDLQHFTLIFFWNFVNIIFFRKTSCNPSHLTSVPYLARSSS
jgi:hypothetical protein